MWRSSGTTEWNHHLQQINRYEAAEQQKDLKHLISENILQSPACSEWLSMFAKTQSEDRARSRVINCCKYG